jgi:DNA-binding transcriptional regulator YhcF (GntR family)
MSSTALPGDGDPTNYKRLAASLRAQTGVGAYEPGDAVPSITELARDSGWGRRVCSRALRLLEGEGLLTFYRGLGYHVSPGTSRDE